MLRYEVLIVTVPEITSDESSSLEIQVGKLIEEYKGKLVSFDRWGKYRLAYQVRGNDYGVYFLLRFELAEENSKEPLTALYNFLTVKHNELIMRHLVVKLDPKASLVYQRPESLEEAPGKGVDSYLKNKRLGGLNDSAINHDDVNDDDTMHAEL
jgi:small subunit ribosomal protein S6